MIIRKERPHPGAQLRLTDPDGMRVTAFATNTARGQLADLELRHRRWARCEDRIRIAKDTGLRNLPLHDFNPEPDLVRHRRPRRRAHRLAADAHPARSPRTPVGTQTPTATAVQRRGASGRPRPRQTTAPLAHAPWAELLAQMITTLQSLPAPG